MAKLYLKEKAEHFYFFLFFCAGSIDCACNHHREGKKEKVATRVGDRIMKKKQHKKNIFVGFAFVSFHHSNEGVCLDYHI